MRSLTVVLAAAFAACGPGDGHVDQPGANGATSSATSSYPLVAARWPSTTISVCWEASADGHPEEKSWVRGKVEEQYGLRTPLRFVGWSRCTPGTRGIRIAVSDRPGDNPHTAGLGREIDGVNAGMQLNFSFAHWSPNCQTRRQSCVTSIAVHEFGHAIGLAHEHNRPDTPSTCTQPQQGSRGDQLVGGWDRFSVMNYCNPTYNNAGNLSDGDLTGIRALYPH